MPVNWCNLRSRNVLLNFDAIFEASKIKLWIKNFCGKFDLLYLLTAGKIKDLFEFGNHYDLPEPFPT